MDIQDIPGHFVPVDNNGNKRKIRVCLFITFRPTKLKFHYIAPQFFIFQADRLNCTKFPSLKCTHISLWLNPTGHSKFHNTSYHPLPDIDSGRTAHTPLYLPVQAVPPYSLPPFFSCHGQRNR